MFNVAAWNRRHTWIVASTAPGISCWTMWQINECNIFQISNCKLYFSTFNFCACLLQHLNSYLWHVTNIFQVIVNYEHVEIEQKKLKKNAINDRLNAKQNIAWLDDSTKQTTVAYPQIMRRSRAAVLKRNGGHTTALMQTYRSKDDK